MCTFRTEWQGDRREPERALQAEGEIEGNASEQLASGRLKVRIRVLLVGVLILITTLSARAQSKHELTISGTRFLLNGAPFPYSGITFFNADYNKEFNQSSAVRRQWMEKFQRYGINVLRIWAEWNISRRAFVDTCDDCTLFYMDGRLRQENVARLKEMLTDADAEGMVIELTLFNMVNFDDNIRMTPENSARALTALTHELLPYRNLTFQIWNELSDHTLDHLKVIKMADPKRLVTNAPGGEGVLGDIKENIALDYLTPHTTRQKGGRHWEIVPREVAYLLARYRKPVVDDEPARNGTPKFGGPAEPTYVYDQILQIYQVWQVGGYINYHHDMFQTGYGTPSVPPSGIPDPEFSPYHRAVLEFIAHRERYQTFGQ